MKKKVKHISLKSLHKKAWKLQSEWIRRSENGICFTCGIHKDWKEQNAGHYIHGDCMDFEEINIHCQCVHCNKYLHGNAGPYAERLIAEYGEQAIADLRQRAVIGKRGKKYTIEELETLINRYTALLKELK